MYRGGSLLHLVIFALSVVQKFSHVWEQCHLDVTVIPFTEITDCLLNKRLCSSTGWLFEPPALSAVGVDASQLCTLAMFGCGGTLLFGGDSIFPDCVLSDAWPWVKSETTCLNTFTVSLLILLYIIGKQNIFKKWLW